MAKKKATKKPVAKKKPSVKLDNNISFSFKHDYDSANTAISVTQTGGAGEKKISFVAKGLLSATEVMAVGIKKLSSLD